MKKIAIFANSSIQDFEGIKKQISDSSLIIAADGGAKHVRSLSKVPDYVIGDLDSISKGDLDKLSDAGVPVIVYPHKKDQTDLELALNLAVEKGAEEILIFSAMGLRWDMTLANVMLLSLPILDGVGSVCIIDGKHEIRLLKGNATMEVAGTPGDILSLIPAGGLAEGVGLKGLEYPLDNARIPFGSTWAVSNVFKEKRALISLEAGMLIVVHIRL